MLLPRPRRFGKTLNLSMLRCWFEKRDTDLSHLFEGLSIWQAGDEYRPFPALSGHPLQLQGEQGGDLRGDAGRDPEKIIDLYKTHRALLDSGRLDEVGERRYRAILDGTAERVLLVAFDGKVVRVRSASE